MSTGASGDFGAEPPEGPLDGREHKIQCNKTDSDEESQGDRSERPTDSPKSPPPEMASFVHVDSDPSDFPFVTTVKDDGRGTGGGWQEAKANLKFEYMRVPGSTKTWYCALTIKMPIRTEAMGLIDPNRAASLSEEITEYVARRMRKDYKLPPGIFCKRFAEQADAAFKSRYPLLGARVTNP